ncbi:MAG: redox-regulated ATPase YchF [Candidatus Caenarcaniphilales bacterium]|nr:redox-regulated ATPase YchF [Candidatus Caenarcaniphilales bacterium]
MLRAGIVGLPNVGKSTLFNALTESFKAEAANFPFCTIEPNIGMVELPDDRLNQLQKVVNAAKIVPTVFEFVDIAGLVKGASEGAGLGNKFLSHIREVDAIVQVVRCFEDGDIHHVDGSINPIRDLETIGLELALADLSSIQKRLDKQIKLIRSGDKAAIEEQAILEKIKSELESLQEITIKPLTEKEREILKPLNLISLKPILVAANLKEEELAKPDQNAHYQALSKYLENHKVPLIPISARIEAELIELDPIEKMEYLQSLGVEESGVKSLIRSAFQVLGLMTYFTAGETEARAWTIPLTCKAPQAAGVIHSDFERGFIKAEVIFWEDLVKLGSKSAAREVGKLRLEGKDYLVQDGDVIEFKFNV